MNGLMSGVGSRAPTGLGSSGGGLVGGGLFLREGVCFRLRLSLFREGINLGGLKVCWD